MRFLVTAWLLVVSFCAGATDWPQWRGPSRDGLLPSTSWPSSLSGENLTQSWSIPLEPSYSGPIVVGDRVFTTQTSNEEWEVVTAHDRKTGKQLWEARWEGAMKVPFFAKANGSWIRSTPAYSDGRLYVAGMRDVLVCLDTDKGEILWKRNFIAELETPLPSFGFVCSPLVHGDKVIVQAGGGVLALNKETGKTVWHSAKDGGGMFGSAFSSPVVATLGGKKQLVVQSRTDLMGLSIEDGTQLWTQPVKAFRGMNILTPSIHKDLVITSAYGGRTHAFRIGMKDEKFTIEEAWNFKAQGYMSSPILTDTHLFLHLRNQRVACIELATGKEAWTSTERFGKYWSMISNGDVILALDQTGILYLMDVDTSGLKILDKRKISDGETWAHVAMGGNEIFVRSLNELSAFQWQPPAFSATSR